jgi:hypothetical protein
LLGALTLLLATTAASTASAASTSTIATTSLPTALSFCLGSVVGVSFSGIGRRSWPTIANLGLLHECLFGCGSVTGTVL